MEYIYILSNILLIISVIIIRKRDEKINFFSTCILTIIIYFCYNPVISLILNIIGIKINLISMTIINFFIILMIYAINIIKYRKIKIQTFYINKIDFLVFIIILIVNIPIIFNEFGIFNNFRFISTDATMHACVAKKFYETQQLVTSLENIEAVNPTFLIGGYVNLGMIMQTFLPIIGEVQIYKLYIIFDVLIYILIGLMFYCLLSKYVNKHKGSQIASVFITIIYMLGYPLNSLITGFQYFSLGILQILGIIYVLKEYQNNKTIPLFILNSGIILTYNLFAPVIFIIEFISILMRNKEKSGKVINKTSIIEIIISLVIPGIIGICFFIIPRLMYNLNLKSSQNLNIDGYIYINYITNIIIFIPFIIYAGYIQIKNKKCSIEMIALWTIFAWMLLFVIGKIIGKISTYYCMKNYYLLVPCILLVFFQAINYLMEKGKSKKVFSYIFISSYSILIICNLLFINIEPYNFIYNSDKSIVDIYNSNKSIMMYIQRMFTKERIEAMEYIEENKLIKNNNLLLISNHIDEHLLQLFFNYQDKDALWSTDKEQKIKEWNNGDIKYLVIFQKDYYLNKYKNIEKGELLFKKGDVLIYRTSK